MIASEQRTPMSNKPLGPPRAKPFDLKNSVTPFNDVKCPNCGCSDLMEIEVEIENNLLKGKTGTGFYVGCPACPYASKMLAVAHAQRTEVES